MEVTIKRIKELMENRNITIRELAENAGCSKSAMQRYISGDRDIPTSVMSGIAAAFKVHPAYLFGWVDDINYYPEDQKQPTQGELSLKKREFIKRVAAMSDEQLDRLEQILALVETKGQ